MHLLIVGGEEFVKKCMVLYISIASFYYIHTSIILVIRAFLDLSGRNPHDVAEGHMILSIRYKFLAPAE